MIGLGRVPFPSELLNRQEASLYLRDLGISIKPGTLAVWASERKGPRYRVIAKRALYLASDIHEWAERKFEEYEPHQTQEAETCCLG